MNDPLLRGQAIACPVEDGLSPANVVMDDDATFVPNLCESWSASADGTVTTFSLRKGVRSHWGNELTSADIRYSVDRAFAVKASVFYFLNSFAGLPSPEHCHITGECGFDLHTPNPTGVVPKLLCSPWFATLDHVAAKDHTTPRDPWSMRWMARNSCSWGPYRIAEWNAGSEVVLEARDDYWRGRPPIQRVIVRKVPRRTDLLGMLQRGEADVVERLLPQEIEQLRGETGVRVMSTRSTGVYQLLMNCSTKPFDDVRVRKAMNFACPQARFIAEVFRGNAEPMRSPCSPLQPGFSDQFWPYEFNPDRAARLLAEAGYPNGFEIDLAYSDNSPAEEQVCRLVQKSLSDLKIQVRLHRLTVAAFNERLYRKEHIFASKLTFTAVRDPAAKSWTTSSSPY
jgi:peptide/nickel transport system substrate-binding protein